MRAALAGGADVKWRNKYGRTALQQAALYGREAVVRVLVHEGGADVNARGYAGWTALHYAVRHDQAGIVSYLLQRGADVTAVSDNGDTAEAVARRCGKAAVAAQLATAAVVAAAAAAKAR